jgi:hypothetical protein
LDKVPGIIYLAADSIIFIPVHIMASLLRYIITN